MMQDPSHQTMKQVKTCHLFWKHEKPQPRNIEVTISKSCNESEIKAETQEFLFVICLFNPQPISALVQKLI